MGHDWHPDPAGARTPEQRAGSAATRRPRRTRVRRRRRHHHPEARAGRRRAGGAARGRAAGARRARLRALRAARGRRRVRHGGALGERRGAARCTARPRRSTTLGGVLAGKLAGRARGAPADRRARPATPPRARSRAISGRTWLRSRSSRTYWVSVTSPPGHERPASRQASPAPPPATGRAGQPAVPAGEQAARSGTVADDLRPLLAGGVDADPAAAGEQVGGHALERRAVAGQRLAGAGLPGVHRLDVEPPGVAGRPAVHARRAGGGREEGQRRCSAPAPSRTATSRPSSSRRRRCRRASRRCVGQVVTWSRSSPGLAVFRYSWARGCVGHRAGGLPRPGQLRGRQGLARVESPPLTPMTRRRGRGGSGVPHCG